MTPNEEHAFVKGFIVGAVFVIALSWVLTWITVP